jgi:hypothetical protein
MENIEQGPQNISEVYDAGRGSEKSEEMKDLEERIKTIIGKKCEGFTVDEAGEITLFFKGGLKLKFTSWNMPNDLPDFKGVEITKE